MTMDTFLPRELPAGLEPLTELALDLRWTWNHAGDQLWRAVDPVAWEATQNPWVILQSTPWERLDALAADASFRQGLTKVVEERRRYLSSTATAGGAPAPGARTTAYFSMEFGLSEALPLYAGGLGVLSGDHLKAASDFGVPLVAIGLLYQEGYFRQFLDASGRQQELYPYNEPTALPIQPALGRSARSARSDGWLIVPVELPGRTLHLRVWRATVGGVVLYLLDSNVPLNDAVDRGITGKLYGDGQRRGSVRRSCSGSAAGDCSRPWRSPSAPVTSTKVTPDLRSWGESGTRCGPRGFHFTPRSGPPAPVTSSPPTRPWWQDSMPFRRR
jgi:glycogen phosphorylase